MRDAQKIKTVALSYAAEAWRVPEADINQDSAEFKTIVGAMYRAWAIGHIQGVEDGAKATSTALDMLRGVLP